MIRQIHIQNSRCLRDVKCTLEPLTVFVGANASGKSAIVQALMGDLGKGVAGKYDQAGNIGVDGTFGSLYMKRPIGTSSYQGTMFRERKHLCLNLRLQDMRAPNQVAKASFLSSTGSNLTNVFYTLRRSERIEIGKQLCALVPMFADVDTAPLDGGHHHIVFQDRWDSSLWYTPGEVSDGTMLMLAFLVLQHHAPELHLVAIEEPERGLHPYLLGELMDFLRRVAHGEVGKAPLQIVLATHSVELLNHTRPEEARFVSRDGEGATVVESINKEDPEWAIAFEVYRNSLAEAWLAGGLGGVPGGDVMGGLKVVLYAEGARETASYAGSPQAYQPGHTIIEDDLGAAHLLLRRCFAQCRRLPEAAIQFIAPQFVQISGGRRRVPVGSDLTSPEQLRKVLVWVGERRPDVIVVLVDSDAKNPTTCRQKIEDIVRELEARGSSRPTRLIAVAVKEFEAWLVADTNALISVLRDRIDACTDPEEMTEGEAKQHLIDLIKTRQREEREVRCSIANQCSLDILRRRCSHFDDLLKRIEHCSF